MILTDDDADHNKAVRTFLPDKYFVAFYHSSDSNRRFSFQLTAFILLFESCRQSAIDLFNGGVTRTHIESIRPLKKSIFILGCIALHLFVTGLSQLTIGMLLLFST